MEHWPDRYGYLNHTFNGGGCFRLLGKGQGVDCTPCGQRAPWPFMQPAE